MKFIRPLLFLLALPASVQAAVSILIQPGSTPGTSVFTVTQTSPNPLHSVPGISGYARGMLLPTTLFHLPGFGPETSSDIEGDLSASVATVTEVFSLQSYQLSRLVIPSDTSLNPILAFDRLFTLPSGAGSLRFDVGTLGPVEINIGSAALHYGTHTANDPLFGTITVTVIPEPATPMLAGAAVLILARRRRDRR